ncbi:MAG: STAS domain-containing protein [Planctomycetes bacterium]|nr:STAS domain-containing protein [Planctomycetota bacterium]
MAIQNLTDELLYLELPKGSFHIRQELEELNQRAGGTNDCDVIVDFANVEVLISVNISNLLILRKQLEEQTRKLILCNVSRMTKTIFEVSGLSEMFKFAENKDSAMQTVS